MTARMWQYTVVATRVAPETPLAFTDFLDGMDVSGWEFVAPVGDVLVFRRRYPGPQVAEPRTEG